MCHVSIGHRFPLGSLLSRGSGVGFNCRVNVCFSSICSIICSVLCLFMSDVVLCCVVLCYVVYLSSILLACDDKW